MDPIIIAEYVEKHTDSGIIPTLIEFIKVPSLSTSFDEHWETNGHMETAMQIIINYLNSLEIQNFHYEILKEPEMPWLFFGTLEATNVSLGTSLMYGHFDKQPHLGIWSEGLGQTTPVLKDGKLYGRGSSDDGYAIPSAGLILKALQDFKIPHGKIFIIGENDEESDSKSLNYYINKLKFQIGEPDLVICLDSGVLSYDRLWLTTSLRGNIIADLIVKTLKNGFHSGGSGISASTFRVVQQLLGRIEDPSTGNILIQELHGKIEPRHHAEISQMVSEFGHFIRLRAPLEEGFQMLTDDMTQIAMNMSIIPTLTVTGIEGLPDLNNAGNLLQPEIKVRCSIRTPPKVNCEIASAAVKKVLLENPPYGAKVTVIEQSCDNGWEQKLASDFINKAVNDASITYFGKKFLTIRVGGSIPFIGFLGDLFPNAQFIVTGLLGPGSNAHTIDESLNIAYLKKLICCLIEIFSTLSKS